MPTGTAVMKCLATMGLDRSFLEGVLRQLRRDGLSASGEKGGGFSGYDWQAKDYATYLCGLAAEGPTSAAATVQALAALPFSGAYSGSSWPNLSDKLDFKDDEGVLTFAVWLASEIDTLKGLSPEEREARHSSPDRATLTLTVYPPRAEVTFYHGSEFFKLVWQHAPKPYPGGNALMFLSDPPRQGLWIDRTAVMPYAILVACADLLASNRTYAIYHPKGSAPGGADPEGKTTDENAPDLAGSRAPVREGQPHRQDAAFPVGDDREAREFGILSQAPFCRGGRRPLHSRKDKPDHACHPS